MEPTYNEKRGDLSIDYGCYINFTSFLINNEDSVRWLVNSYSRDAVGNLLVCSTVRVNLQEEHSENIREQTGRALFDV